MKLFIMFIILFIGTMGCSINFDNMLHRDIFSYNLPCYDEITNMNYFTTNENILNLYLMMNAYFYTTPPLKNRHLLKIYQ
jgi:hypothetical protein